MPTPTKRKSLNYCTPGASRMRRRRLATDHTPQNDATANLPIAYRYSEENFQHIANIGEMSIICPHCSAAKFPLERPGFCCNNGRVDLPPFPPWPDFLQQMTNPESPFFKHFMENIRPYNSAFQMTSFACREREQQGWKPTFSIHGQIFHRIGNMYPTSGREPEFLQIYFIDNMENQVQRRMAIFGDLNKDIVQNILNFLTQNNKYVKMFLTTHEYIQREGHEIENMRVVIHEDKRPMAEHPRRYNAPTSNEVGILMPNDPAHTRDIIIHLREGPIQRVSELHRSYDPLQYPLLFPYGSDGYSIYLKNSLDKKVTQLQYYAYHIQRRAGNDLPKAGRLFQQFLVDVYCKVETERLNFIRREQKTLRADNYANLRDSIIRQDSDPRELGQKVILPSTYVGGPRYMHERQQDAITYVTNFGRPQLFITSTTNPKWPEIVSNLLPGQSANDDPVLTVRVFNLKKERLMSMIKDGSFGQVAAWLYSIEFQKRGLPHVHILAWLKSGSKIVPDDIDKIVSAEIPSSVHEPELHNLVKANMIHGPCGPIWPNAPCMAEGTCTKKFPKDFRDETHYGNDGYPKYRRQSPESGGNTITVTKVIQGQRVSEEVDNRYVVPYNKWLLRQMGCHTNVEICSSVKSIKYVLKYVNKGSDQAIFSIQLRNENDEILLYQEARYVGSMEAAHRLLSFPIHEHWPPVMQLAVHLENGQRVYFTPENAQDKANAEPPKTTLTEFMRLCERDDFAKTLLYHEVPQYYTWINKTWCRRKVGVPQQHEGIKKGPMLGRVYTIHPNLAECYYLRLLLHVVRGPDSFAFLRRVDGVQYDTYREVCLVRGLLANDQHLIKALMESQETDSHDQMRLLFALIISTCEPADPVSLWLGFKDAMSEDIAYRNGLKDQEPPYPENIYQQCLISINNNVERMTNRDIVHFGLPYEITTEEGLGIEYTRYCNYSTDEQLAYLQSNSAKFNPEQQYVFDEFNARILQQTPGIIFLDAPGGTGKTFLINVILASVRSRGQIAVACASSGIAANLLTGGKTIHSTFHVPLQLDITEFPTCAIKKGTALARVMKECQAIVIDEAPMTHRKAYEAIDRTLRDIRENDTPFGGIPTMLCGDFRQILPVVRHGTRANIVDATLKKSYLWHHTKTMQLKSNMRLQADAAERAAFSEYLQKVGDGLQSITDSPDYISLSEFSSAATAEELILSVYKDINANVNSPSYFMDKAILAPINETVNSINHRIIDEFPGEPMTYNAINSTMNSDDAVHYPQEFLNTIELSGVPSHRLTLKVGCPVIMMRSLDPPELTNGTRCVISKLRPNVIEVELLTGQSKGKKRLVPRIPVIPSDTDLPFAFKRIQFPVKPCFALTINKAQGQTFSSIGLHLLESNIFTHGMLYVALSRVRSKGQITVLAPEQKSRNVVYKEVLQ